MKRFFKMKIISLWMLVIVTLTLEISGVERGKVRGRSSIKVGKYERGSLGSKSTNRTRNQKPTTITASMSSLEIPLDYSTPTLQTEAPIPDSNVTETHVPDSNSSNVTKLNVGLAVPYKSFGIREYTRAISKAIKMVSRGGKVPSEQNYEIDVKLAMMEMTPSPMEILDSLCKTFLPKNVSAIIYLMNHERYGRSTASTQYFLTLAQYLGIPVIAWNADNSGLTKSSSRNVLRLQLAPSIEHQVSAMLSILERYKWHQFSVVTSDIAGHADFVQAVRDRIKDLRETFKMTLLSAITWTKRSDLEELSNSDSRIMLLYSTKQEASSIMRDATVLKLTGANYVWIVTQSVVENRLQSTGHDFPIGLVGVHFDTSSEHLVKGIETAIKVYAQGVQHFIGDKKKNSIRDLTDIKLSCEDSGDTTWKTGKHFFKYLKNVTVEDDFNKKITFSEQDGTLKWAELKIVNLRTGANNEHGIWEEIGTWKSWEKAGLNIKDIVWPGSLHTPPQGVPEKFHLKISFLEEPPYIHLAPPDPITGKCLLDRGVHCRIKDANVEESSGEDPTLLRNFTSSLQCCSGFCIDLLQKFSEEVGFTYDLVRVEDGKWGTFENGKWNGLVAELVNRKSDMVMSSLKINSERERHIDFTDPFLDTGTAIVVAKRTGLISPTAFLEPFDTASWMLVGIVAIHSATFMIFFFEWLSPTAFGMNDNTMGSISNSEASRRHIRHRFSLCRVYWLVWAVLFQAAVHVDSPRGFTARFMTNIWAMFAVVFLAIYTANLAAFMITREEYFDLSGLDDSRLAKPMSHKPMLKFGTVPWTHTHRTISIYFKEMFFYMKNYNYNKHSVQEGVEAVLSGELDAFIYDGTVIDYLVSKDENCRLLTVGKWYAMTGYGLAFPRNSKYLNVFNKKLLEYRDNGDLERLRRYWMTGTCRPDKEAQKTSDPLALEQFLSAFLMLMVGTLIAAVLLFFECMYFKYVRQHLSRRSRAGKCCAMLSVREMISPEVSVQT